MALTITLLGGSPAWTTASGVKTVTATPAVGDLIVIAAAHSANTSTTATPPTDNQSGTYAFIAQAGKLSDVAFVTMWVRTALMPTNASTVFTHDPGVTTGGGLAVMKVAGAFKFGLGAISQCGVQANQAASVTPTVALAQAALTGNALIGAMFNGSTPAGVSQRASPAWAELCDVGYTVPTTGFEVMSINSGETGSSIAWGSTSLTEFGAIVVEIDADAQVVPQLAVARGGLRR